MSFLKIFWIVFFATFCATAQDVRLGDGVDPAPRIERATSGWESEAIPPRTPERTVNMLEFMIPPQAANAERQFYLEGSMECLGVPGSGCFLGGEPRYARGNFQKQTLTSSDEKGNVRFSSSKGRRGLLAYPCEYHETREEFDEYGRPVTILYLRAEMMDWVENRKYRAYYDGLGEPLFEWGRSRAVVGKAYTQDMGVEIRHECGNVVTTVPVPLQNYVVHVYNLEGDLEEVNRRMGNMGPVIPEWVGMAHEMGQKAELLVVEGLWGWTKDSPGPEPWRWVYRELYMYLKGVGWVSWRWQEHEDGDLSKPFITEKMGNMDTIVWEKPGEFVRNAELCEAVK